jgi:hypothetical protein
MELVVDPRGQIIGLYSEAIDLARLGTLTIRRASQVEPDRNGQWHADLAPLDGPKLGPFDQRSQALKAEEAWIANVWMKASPRTWSTRSAPFEPQP